MEPNLENRESLPVVETVRVALFHRGKFLLLLKSADSKNPAANEFPGGKIDDIAGANATEEEQKRAAINEVRQETGINIANLPMKKIENFEMYFESDDKDQNKKGYKRRIHLFLILLPDEENFFPVVGQTKSENGDSEDNHDGYIWASPEELRDSSTSLRENRRTGKRTYPLARSSRHIKKLLEAVIPHPD